MWKGNKKNFWNIYRKVDIYLNLKEIYSSTFLKPKHYRNILQYSYNFNLGKGNEIH